MRKTLLPALSLLGLFDSLYLLWVYTSPSRPIVCLGSGCDAVRASSYAHLFGLPLPAFGVASYALLGLLIFAEVLVSPRLGRAIQYAVAGISCRLLVFHLPHFAGSVCHPRLVRVVRGLGARRNRHFRLVAS